VNAEAVLSLLAIEAPSLFLTLLAIVLEYSDFPLR